MKLSNVALLASNTSRTKAYIQEMIRQNVLPSLCIVYVDDYKILQEEKSNYSGRTEFGDYFNKEIPLLTLIEKYDLEYIVVEDKDINSEKMVNCIKDLLHRYLIYSGYGGYILKPELFYLGKKYIHVHAGILPRYRGSTTAYYSILQEGYMGATAIFLNEAIDEGEIICQNKFKLPAEDIDIDYIYEPYTRAKVLLIALKEYFQKNDFNTISQNENDAEIYYIIHPVLKHLAINRVKKVAKT